MTNSVFPAKVRSVLLLVCVALGPAGLPADAADSDSSSAKPVGRWQDASLEDYRKHLITLEALTQGLRQGARRQELRSDHGGSRRSRPHQHLCQCRAAHRALRMAAHPVLARRRARQGAGGPGREETRQPVGGPRARLRSQPPLSFLMTRRSAWQATWSRPRACPRRLLRTIRNAPS